MTEGAPIWACPKGGVTVDYCSNQGGSDYRRRTDAQGALRLISILHVIVSFVILRRSFPACLLMLSAGICGIRASVDARKSTPCVVLSAAVLVHHIHYTVTSFQRRPPVDVMGDLSSPEEVFIFFIAPLIICIVAWFTLSAAAVVLGLIVKKQSEGSGPDPS